MEPRINNYVSVVKNSRTETTFNRDFTCSMCEDYHTYLIHLESPGDCEGWILCPSCLQKMIDKIHKQCLDDCHVNTRRTD